MYGIQDIFDKGIEEFIKSENFILSVIQGELEDLGITLTSEQYTKLQM